MKNPHDFEKSISKESRKERLKNHLKNLTPHCKICDTYFPKGDFERYESHKSVHHLKPYPCKECQVSFKTEPEWSRHLTNMHNRRQNYHILNYKCTRCNKEFETPDQVKVHQYCHREKKCQVCGYFFETLPELTLHMKEEHPKNFRNPDEPTNDSLSMVHTLTF